MAIIPAFIKAGISTPLSRIKLRDYPSTSWALRLILRGPAAVQVAGTADADGLHSLNLSAAITGAWPAGIYAYSLRVTDGVDVHEVESSTVEVLADLDAVVAGIDQRSHARRVLDNIEAVLEKRSTQDQEKYRINNRELWRTPLPELLTLKNQYAAIVRREEAKANGKPLFGPAVRVRL